MPRVICAGHVNWDVTLRVDGLPEADGEARILEQRQGGGGSASNVATVLSQLEIDVTLFGSVGDDEYGTLARSELSELGVDADLVLESDDTTVKYLIVGQEGEVMVLGNDGANEAFGPEDARKRAETIQRADHVHLTGQNPATAERITSLAQAADVPVSFAPGRRVANRDYGSVARRADLLFVNAQEAHAYCEDPESTAAETGQTVVVTHGGGGARICTPEETFTSEGFDVESVDTAGSGDAFAAGFIAARFDRDLRTALAVGNACGAIAARSMGARTHLRWDDVEAMR